MIDFDNIHVIWPNTQPEEQKKAQFYHDLDVKFRGTFLIQANWVESDIDAIIALTFCGNNKNNSDLIRSILLKHLTFDAKIKILNEIIKLKYRDFKINNKENTSRFDRLQNNLQIIKSFRNKLAHSSLSITKELLC